MTYIETEIGIFRAWLVLVVIVSIADMMDMLIGLTEIEAWKRYIGNEQHFLHAEFAKRYMNNGT